MRLPCGTITTDSIEIADNFNTYFSSIGHTTQSKLAPSLLDYDDLIPVNNSSILWTPSTPSEVENIIKNLKNKGGSLDLPIHFLKKIKQECSIMLSDLFNMIRKSSTYPDILQIARISLNLVINWKLPILDQ